MRKSFVLIALITFCILQEGMSQWNTSGSNIYNTNTGNVGIGTTTPSTLLYVAKNMSEPNITVRNLGGTGGATYTMIDDVSSANWKFKATNSGGFKIRDHGNSLDVITIEPNSTSNAIYINSSGYIGLGSNNPMANLHLNVGGTNAYAGLCISSLLTGGKALTINQGTAGRINFTEPGVVDLVTMDFIHQNVGINSTSPANSAIFEVNSTSKGMLIPRMTMTQIASIQSPADGLQVYCTTNGKLYIYVTLANQWKEVSYGSGAIVPFICGSSLTVNHIVGQVAPVTKTVTYGTVTNVPGEPGKCWITSNLGADHQATAVDDATEASASWYWQFNRRQGYKHDGTTRTPNTIWTFVIENSNWSAVNDPCSIEINGNWRLPSEVEYSNIWLAGGWGNWFGPWNSALKMHASGQLYREDGHLSGRGLDGDYWSCTQDSMDNAHEFFFYSVSCWPNNISEKMQGNTVRCLREY